MVDMTPYSEIYERFLSLITEYDFFEMDQEEFEAELEVKLEMAVSKLVLLSIEMDVNTQSFTQELTPLEKTILAHALLGEWLSQRVYDVQNMRNHMASSDFKIFSNANHLAEMVKLQQYALKEVDYLIGQYALSQALVRVRSI